MIADGETADYKPIIAHGERRIPSRKPVKSAASIDGGP